MATEIKEFCFNIMSISLTTTTNSIMSPSTIKSIVDPTFIYGGWDIFWSRAIVVIYVNQAIKVGQVSFDYPSSCVDILNNSRSASTSSSALPKFVGFAAFVERD